MPNTFVDPSKVARMGIAMVTKDLKLAQTFNRDFESEFGGGHGHTVNVRVPAVLQARSKTLRNRVAITTDTLTESTVPVALTDVVYSAVPVTDEELTLDIVDFGRQVLAPQALAIVEDLEGRAVTTMQGVAESLTVPYAAATPGKTFTTVRKMLRDMGAPESGLTAAVGTQIYADLIESGELKDASQSGSTDALRNAVAGRVRGFDTIESNRLADDEMVFYIRGVSFSMAIRAPQKPAGVAFGSSMAENGFAMRWIRDYDSVYLEDRSILSTFVGTKVMTMKRSGDGATVTPTIRVKASTVPA